MVKLPDAVGVFGVDHPTLKTNRSIVSYDETGDARGQQMAFTGKSRELAGEAAEHGMEAQSRGIEAQAFDTDRQTAIINGQSGMAVGKGISQAGENIARAGQSFQDIFDKEKAKRDNLESATADSQYLTQRVNLKSALDDESDPEGLTDKYAPQTADMLNSAAAAITDPEKRKLWLLKRQADVASLNVEAKDKQFSLLKDKTIAEAQTELDNLRNAGIQESDPAKKQEILQAGLNRINALNDAGYIDDTKAVALKKGWAQGYIVGNLERLSPAERVMTLDGVSGSGVERAAALIRSKEGFRTSTYWDVNHHRVGYGSDTITLPDGSVKEVKQGDTVTREDAERDLLRRTNQSMNQARAAIGGSLFDKLSANQQAALTSMTYNYGSLPSNVADAAHEGPEALARAIESRAGDNGGVNRARRQQEAMLVRTPDGTSDGRTRLASLLPEDERRSMADKAREDFRREIVSNERAAQAEIKTQQASVSNLITDDLSSLERSGKGNDKLQRDQVVKVFGEEAAKSWDAERIRSRKVFETMDGIEQLTPPEVDARLRQLEPQPGSEGYAEDMKAYQRAQKKVQEFTTARAQDPALAVEALPNVKEARAAAQYDEGPDGQKRIKPESAQAIVRARLVAQNHVGIEEPMAVTKAEARVIARNLRYVGEDDQKGLERTMGAIKATYGDLAEPVLASVLQHERVNRDLSVAATEVLHQVGIKKQMPTPDQAKRLDTAIESQKLTSALDGTTYDPMGNATGAAPGTGGAAPAKGDGKGATKTAEAAVSGPKQANKPVDPEDVRGLLTGKLDPKQFDATYGTSGLANQIIKRSAEMGYKASVMPAPTAPAAPPIQMQAPPVAATPAGSKPYTGGFRVERTADGKIRALIPAQ